MFDYNNNKKTDFNFEDRGKNNFDPFRYREPYYNPPSFYDEFAVFNCLRGWKSDRSNETIRQITTDNISCFSFEA